MRKRKNPISVTRTTRWSLSSLSPLSGKLQFAELIKSAFLYTFRCTARASLASHFGRGGRAQRGRRGQTMTIPKDNTQLENARRLRREMTPHERKLWYLFLRKYPVMCMHKLILSFEKGYKTLSVTCGDSSPKGRAKGLHPLHKYVA